MANDKRVKFQDTHPMDKKLMDKIGWSERDVASYLSSYSNFEDNEKDEQQQHKKPRSRVQKVETPQSVKIPEKATKKAPEKAAAAAAKMDESFNVVEDV